MSADAVTTLSYKRSTIFSLDGEGFDIKTILEFDYYEDILKTISDSNDENCFKF